MVTQTQPKMACSRRDKVPFVAAGQTPLFGSSLSCATHCCHPVSWSHPVMGGWSLASSSHSKKAPLSGDKHLRSSTIVIKDAQAAMPDEIWISVIVSYAAKVYQKAAQRLQVLYYCCTLQRLQLTAYLYFHADSAKQVDLFSVLS